MYRPPLLHTGLPSPYAIHNPSPQSSPLPHPHPQPHTPVHQTPTSSDSTDSWDFMKIPSHPIPPHALHPHSHQLQLPATLPVQPNTPHTDCCSSCPSTFDQTNYVQRGNITGHWATYFSGPNFLKVNSFMGQPYPPL